MVKITIQFSPTWRHSFWMNDEEFLKYKEDKRNSGVLNDPDTEITLYEDEEESDEKGYF